MKPETKNALMQMARAAGGTSVTVCADNEPDFEEADNGKCPYCGKLLTLDGTTLYCEEGCF